MYTSNSQRVSSRSLSGCLLTVYLATIQLSTWSVMLTGDWNSKPKFKFREWDWNVPLHFIVKFLVCWAKTSALWMVATYGSHWNCRQTLCELVKFKTTAVSSQVLSSLLSTSSDCSHCDTTTNELKHFANTNCMRPGGYVCSASWY